MLVKDILELAAMFVDRQDLCSYSPFTTTEAPETEASEIEILKKCYNLVIAEIASDYCPLRAEEEVNFTDGEFSLASLSNDICKIVKLTKPNGKAVKFELFGDNLRSELDTGLLTYEYIPAEQTYTDTAITFGGRVPSRVIAYGIAREFSLVSGLFEDASVWESRFKDGLKLAVFKKSEIRLPARRWI